MDEQGNPRDGSEWRQPLTKCQLRLAKLCPICDRLFVSLFLALALDRFCCDCLPTSKAEIAITHLFDWRAGWGDFTSGALTFDICV